MTKKMKVLALSSGGGHWVQLLRLRPAFAGSDVTFATVNKAYQADITEGHFEVIADCNRARKLRALWSVVVILRLLLRLRPDVVVTTGALPGYLALRIASLLGIRTIWVDSIANAEELSMSGQMAGKHADVWLTQWPHLAREGGPMFLGSVL